MRLLAASHGWQTLLAAIVTGAIALIVAVATNGGSGADGGAKREQAAQHSPAGASVSINSITQDPDPYNPSSMVITLRGEFEGLQRGWVVYTLGKTVGETSDTFKEGDSRDSQSGSDRWLVQQATIESMTTWESVFTVNNLSKKTRWYAVLARKYQEPEVSGTCRPGGDCGTGTGVRGTMTDLENYGPDSSYVKESSNAKELRVKGRH